MGFWDSTSNFFGFGSNDDFEPEVTHLDITNDERIELLEEADHNALDMIRERMGLTGYEGSEDDFHNYLASDLTVLDDHGVSTENFYSYFNS
ncbi:MAG: hypothetical protein U9N49_10185 [Campylobacterota bacterium]|nr:hypothetical protein [Campylobacterota bacterium]